MQFILIAIEALLVVLLAAAALLRPGAVIRATEPLMWAVDWMARYRVASIVLCAALPLAIRLVVMPSLGVRAPKTQDEFAQLLQAETFARGRLSTPPPVLPRHFESVHVSVEPSYFSKYPPAKATMLAVGQRYLGHPWWGAWLSIGLMCAAICWMLQQWLPPRWALLGGLLVAVKLGIFSYWMNSYWGGAVAAAGGALVLGAARGVWRATRSRPPRARDVVVMSLGAIILANSRPFEGFLLCAAVVVLSAIGVFQAQIEPRTIALKVALPALLVLLPGAALMARYHTALTGEPTRFPYALNSSQYRMAGQFIFSAPRPEREYRHAHLRRFYERERATQLSKRSLGAMPRHVSALGIKIWLFFIAPALTLALLALPRLARSRKMRPLLIVGGVVGVGLIANAFFIPHYAAPLLALMVAALVHGLRHLQHFRWRGAPVGMALARGIPAVVVLTVAARFALPRAAMASVPEYPLTWYWTDPGGTERDWILGTFEDRPGRHLLFVDYDESASPHTEWVYNGADMHSQTVVWARFMSPQENVELMRHFPDRTPWVLVVSAAGNEIWPVDSTGRRITLQPKPASVTAYRPYRSSADTVARTPSSIERSGTQPVSDRSSDIVGGS